MIEVFWLGMANRTRSIGHVYFAYTFVRERPRFQALTLQCDRLVPPIFLCGAFAGTDININFAFLSLKSEVLTGLTSSALFLRGGSKFQVHTFNYTVSLRPVFLLNFVWQTCRSSPLILAKKHNHNKTRLVVVLNMLYD